MDHVKTAVSSLRLGEPTTHGGLTVFPLTTGFRSKLRYLLLEEGLRKDLVTIREVSEGGSVPELKVENRAGLPVLIVDGEELVGAKQNRVANLTMLIPAERTTIIPVSCVEAGRWSYRTPHFDVSDRVQNARGRAEKLESVRHSIRERGSRRSDQSRVWDSIEEEAAVLGAPSPTSEMGAMFERHRETLDDYVGAVNAAPEQVGAVFLVGGRRYGLDLFDRPATLAAFLPKLVRSYAIDVLGRRPREREESPDGEARDFLNRIVGGTYDDHAAVGLGRDVGVVGEGLVAGALVARRTVVHLTAFAEPAGLREDSAVDRSPGGRYASYRQRLDSLRSRYER
ncbi:MAG: hypothetical protein F4139_11645 [Gemmatimonadetes bacterium]|nr:hypothetical protein [Gemmatimonadota bacterium]MYH53575.1 hypothetical protein [Gemmatimonadota bacterium]MYK67081.1 hypothetical protein [Gemmatimonadota bacterium]